MLILENLCYYTEVTVINDTVSLAWSNIYIKTSLRFSGVQTRLRRTISLYRTRNHAKTTRRTRRWQDREQEERTSTREGARQFAKPPKGSTTTARVEKKNQFSLKINTQVDSLKGGFRAGEQPLERANRETCQRPVAAGDKPPPETTLSLSMAVEDKFSRRDSGVLEREFS